MAEEKEQAEKKPVEHVEEIEIKKNDAQEVREILEVVSKEVPALIRNIFAALYSSDIASEYGKGIGMLYKELKEQGLPEEMIREIVLKYADSINVIGNSLQFQGKKSEARKKSEE